MPLLIAVLGLVVLVLAGCATVPGSSDVTVLRRVGDPAEPSAPPGPARGAGPLELVRGWIVASGATAERHSAARAFLSPPAAGSWDDGSSPTVVSDRVDTVFSQGSGAVRDGVGADSRRQAGHAAPRRGVRPRHRDGRRRRRAHAGQRRLAPRVGTPGHDRAAFRPAIEQPAGAHLVPRGGRRGPGGGDALPRDQPGPLRARPRAGRAVLRPLRRPARRGAVRPAAGSAAALGGRHHLRRGHDGGPHPDRGGGGPGRGPAHRDRPAGGPHARGRGRRPGPSSPSTAPRCSTAARSSASPTSSPASRPRCATARTCPATGPRATRP